MNENENYLMSLALQEAQKAKAKGEVPVGAVVVRGGQVIARGHNVRETVKSPLGHAELVALHRAAKFLGNWQLLDCDLYVTLEPCFMCSAALAQSRIRKVVFGAYDPKRGGLVSHLQMHCHPTSNHHFTVLGGVLEKSCQEILRMFFQDLRVKKKSSSKKLTFQE